MPQVFILSLFLYPYPLNHMNILKKTALQKERIYTEKF